MHKSHIGAVAVLVGAGMMLASGVAIAAPSHSGGTSTTHSSVAPAPDQKLLAEIQALNQREAEELIEFHKELEKWRLETQLQERAAQKAIQAAMGSIGRDVKG